MKTLLILLLLIPFAGFSQSKKELNAQLAKQMATTDSLELVLKEQKITLDTLKLKSAFQQAQVSRQEKILVEYRTLNHEYKEEISRLEEELDNCISKGKTATPPKPVKKKDNPFGGSGGHVSGEGPGIGNDDGNGDEPVNKRYQIKSPVASQIKSKETCTITYSVFVSPDGKVVNLPTVIKAGTTTTDKDLIDSVARILQEELLYNKIAETQYITTIFTIKITANQ